MSYIDSSDSTITTPLLSSTSIEVQDNIHSNHLKILDIIIKKMEQLDKNSLNYEEYLCKYKELYNYYKTFNYNNSNTIDKIIIGKKLTIIL
jgi:hypothetical protein